MFPNHTELAAIKHTEPMIDNKQCIKDISSIEPIPEQMENIENKSSQNSKQEKFDVELEDSDQELGVNQ